MVTTANIVSPFPSTARASEVAGYARATGSMASLVIGKAQSLIEYATGGPPLGETGQLTEKNPQGLFGVDLSGPPWGPARLHNVANLSGYKGGTYSREDYFDANAVRVFRWFQKPFARGNLAPYSRAYIGIIVKLDSGGSVAASLTIRDQNGNQKSIVTTVASTTAAMILNGEYIDAVPGINKCTFRWEPEDARAKLLSVCLYNLVPITHT